jgi:DNA-binding GntR family transcriptional regulator
VTKKTLNNKLYLAETSNVTGYRTLIERAYQELREDIVNGKLAPGTKLLIEHLKDRYQVGAGTLREALTRLLSDALVITEGQRGFKVAPIAIEELIDITHLRVTIETQALRDSIRQGDAQWRKDLQQSYEILSQFEQPLLPAYAKDWEKANAKFHVALLAACTSPWTLRVLHQLTQNGERYRRYAIGLQTERDVHSEHELIFNAAMEGNEARASLALEAHIRATPELLIKSVQNGINVFHQKQN